MAGNSKDVSLVIKAKNDATAAIESVSKALKDLTDAQSSAAVSAGKTDSMMGQLKDALTKLNAETKGLSALGVISEQMDKAAGAVGRLQNAVSKSQSDMATFAESQRASRDYIANLTTLIDSEAAALKKQKDAVDAARKAQTEANKEFSKAETVLNNLNTRVGKQQTPSDDLVKRAAQQRDLVAQLQSEKQAASDTYGAEKLALEQLKTSYADLKAAKTSASSNDDRITRDANNAAKAYETNAAALKQAQGAMSDISAIANRASSALGGIAPTQEAIAAASAKAAVDVDKLSAALKRQSATGTTSQSVVAPEATVAGYKAQVEAIQQAKVAYADARAEATRLGKAMADAKTPTDELQREFLLAKDASAAAKAAYIGQAQALGQLRGVSNSTFAQFAQATAQVQPLAQATNQVASATRNIPPIARQAAQGLTNLGSAAAGAGSGLASAGNSSREALDLFQRLRGQVLSLAASYIGLQAAIGQLGGVVSAYRTVEAAQSRLGVVFNQDGNQIQNEMAYLNQQAGRLGISFETLSDQYSKFAIAAKTSNFTMQDTRKIFLSVAEAARVNKLSVDQTNGVFLALEQMISKGKVSSEELRRQLGDRLSGAFSLFAEAIGVSTAELDKMMKKGEVLADDTTMLKFADEMNRRYGPQLATSLKTTTAELGRFQNEIFNAQLRVAQGGFLDAFTEAVRKLNEYFKSREGRDFFLAIGQAAGTAVRALTALIPYISELKILIGAIIGMQFAGTISRIGAAIAAAAGGFATFASALTGATSLIGGLGVAARALTAALGGIPGIIATIVGAGVTYWATSVDKATQALDEHQRILEAVRAAYVANGAAADDWAKKIEGVTKREAETNSIKLTQAANDSRASLQTSRGSSSLSFFDQTNINGNGVKDQFYDLARLEQQWVKLGGNVDDYKKKISDIATASGSDAVKAFADQLLANAEATRKYEEGAQSAQRILAIFNGTADEASKSLDGVGTATKDVTDNTAKAAEAQQAYTDATNKLKAFLPDLSDDMKLLQKDAKIDDVYAEAQKALEQYAKQAGMSLGTFQALSKQLTDMRDAAKDAAEFMANQKFGAAVEGLTGNADGIVQRIIKIESNGNPNASNPNSTAVGLGQFTESTWLGLFDKVFPELQELNATQKLALRTNAEASTKMLDALTKENAAQLARAGVDATPGNLYLAHFLGAGDAIKVALANPDELAANIVTKSSVAANKTVFTQGLTIAQLQAWATGKMGGVGGQLDNKGNTKQENFDADLQRQSDLRKAEIEGQKESTREATIAKAVQEARNKAAKDGVAISDDQIKRIEQETGAIYDAKHAGDAKNKAEKDALNELIGLDRKLQAAWTDYQTAQKQGNQQGMDDAKSRITSLTQQIKDLIPNARDAARAIGDEKALGTLDKIAAAAGKVGENLRRSATESTFLGLNISQLEGIGRDFASGFSNMFGDFLSGLREGKKGMEALKDAFLNFASSFLLKIGQMIVEQALLNMLQATIGNSFRLSFVKHEGGLVGAGSSARVRSVDPMVFMGARRFHSGGLPGLSSDEVPAILQRGEEVLSKGDPRNILNGGLSPGAAPAAGTTDLKIINTFDPADVLSAAMDTVPGQRVLTNYIQRNKNQIRKILG